MEHMLVLNIILAFVWLAITADASIENVLFGFILGWMVLFLIRHNFSGKRYVQRIWMVIKLILFFKRELCLSVLRVSYIILFRKGKHRSAIFSYPLRVKSDFQITLLANMITLTPGTLSVDVTSDKKYLYIHALDASSKESMCKDIHDGFERMILEAFQ